MYQMNILGRHHQVSLWSRFTLNMYATRWKSTSNNFGSVYTINTPEEMEILGGKVAQRRSPGDVIFLNGDLGSGKTCFARGFIRNLTNTASLKVTSPTYLLVNTYESSTIKTIIHHVDLYRLDTVTSTDLTALGLEKAFQNGITLIEWPQRLQDASIPMERLEVYIENQSPLPCNESMDSPRQVTFKAFGKRWLNFNINS